MSSNSISVARERWKEFAQEFVVDFNAAGAAVRCGYSKRSAKQIANDLLQKPEVQGFITDAIEARKARTQVDADTVVQRLATIALADARTLTSLTVGPCRYCWGEDHLFQWKTPREFEEALSEHTRKFKADENAPPEPTDEGGYGYRLTGSTNPSCPECAGMGIPVTRFADTRDLPPEAVVLFRGIKETQHGIEVKTADQDKALELLGRHLGLFAGEQKDTVDALAEALRQISSRGSSSPLSSPDESKR